MRKKGKLDLKAEERLLVGYPEGVKGYKLWNFKDHFCVSRDISFDEDYSPCKHVQAANISPKVRNSNDEPVTFQTEQLASSACSCLTDLNLMLCHRVVQVA